MRAFFDRDLGDEVAHLANSRLGFFFGRRLDHVFDLGARGVHRLELKSWHSIESVRSFSRELVSGESLSHTDD